jgi:hypothetical protein
MLYYNTSIYNTAYGEEGFLGKPNRQKRKYSLNKWEDFKNIGIQTAHLNGIEYVNIRDKFLESVPWWWCWYGG